MRISVNLGLVMQVTEPGHDEAKEADYAIALSGVDVNHLDAVVTI
ncbi:hypothetical protein S58_24630 [Bradyrhizobium oligotrophicum S58]|uniref:Uncharacterized protein n=1 Tax=Bradyrhizobium oligotrophicum S58 TaxID=1245469 RepID=M4Z5B3_9BRAD|nr:hypothetical protein [Bradyrhizobium oligotrophicum]BAM88469.1 hypothetical protein S58_24630 [Bradyrhizobium oligotrophicum S58]